MRQINPWSAEAVSSVLTFNLDTPKASVLDHPLLRSVIAESAPYLIKGDKKAEQQLAHIKHYLFLQPNLTDKNLKSKLPEELYTSLYGLKRMLKSQNLRSVERQIEASKRITLLWLESLQEEE